MSLHSGHSKVRIWKPKRPDVTRASIVADWQIGHSGPKWKDMVARLDQAGAQHSQSPGRCRYKAGDGVTMPRRDTDAMFNFAHFHKEINDWFTN
jgi:hypothetical protein